MQPINYLEQVSDPFTQALQGVKIGAGLVDLQTQRAEAARQQQLLQQQQQAIASERTQFFSNPKPTVRDALRLVSLLPPEQAKALQPYMDSIGKERQQNVLRSGGQILSALQTNPTVGTRLLRERATAEVNDPEEAALYTRLADASENPDLGPGAAFKGLTIALGSVPGAKEMFESIDKTLGTQRSEALAPSALKEQVAKSELAVQQTQNAVATAVDDVAKARAQRQFEESKARLEALKEKFAEQEGQDAITKRLADLNLTKAQTNKYQVETRNLNDTGKMLRLDYEAAVKGVPLPSKNAGATVGNATEDERKAAGWLAQASNAYSNMLGAMYTKDKQRTGAEEVTLVEKAFGGFARGPERQKFVQAASSLSEALLRAATGAGVNQDEAKQKLEELTPLLTDGDAVIKQKLAAIPVYLDSLKARAGRAAPQNFQIPTVESALQRKSLTITLPDGKEYTAPDQATLDEFRRRSKL